MKKYLKNTNGITLIALIITVIIMLILAGVAISALTTDGGLFSKTQSAVEKYNNAVKLQDEKISSLINEMNTYFDKYSNKDVVTTDSLPPKEFEVIYDILEYRNGKFVEVLSASTKIK